MKSTFAWLLLLAATTASYAQIANDNRFSVQIDGKPYQTQPRRIQLGRYWWITANSLKPDRSIRVWLGNADKTDLLVPGTYLIVDADKPDTKKNWEEALAAGTYKGIAVIKFVEETREPRMEYHVGKSQNNHETITVKQAADGFLEAQFSSVALAGSYWKEKPAATVFGGLGRLTSKLEDKVITKTTGYDSDIDPEGNGYKRQDKTDAVTLTDGKFRLKL